MNAFSREQAILKLGKYAFIKGTSKVIESRINKIIDFSKTHGNFDISTNNNWSKPKNYKNLKAFTRIGGTTYKYQVWAVVLTN